MNVINQFKDLLDFLYSLSADQWSAIGQWVGAAATVWAVIVSLKIANEAKREAQPKVKIKVREHMFIGLDDEATNQEHIQFEAVNIGNAPVVITKFYFRIKLSKKERRIRKKFPKHLFEILQFPLQLSHILPRTIKPTETLNIRIPKNAVNSTLARKGYIGTRTLIVSFVDISDRVFEETFILTVH